MKKESWIILIQTNKLNSLNIDLDIETEKTFQKYYELFLIKNSQLNLISKNDEKFLFEKHIFDSLSINLFLTPQKGQTLLDIGTGGGFPSVPLAIYYKDLKVCGIDSIKKKINAVDSFKQELSLDNLTLICDRVENISEKFDYVVSRAVSSLDKILEFALPHVKDGGYFIAYKSKKYEEELKLAKNVIKKYKLKEPEIVSYCLPLSEPYERNLIIFKKG